MEKNCQVKPKTVREFFTSRYFWKPFTGFAVGAVAGFAYYYFIGCTSGSCPITGNPYLSILMGGLLGLFMVNSPCSRGTCSRGDC